MKKRVFVCCAMRADASTTEEEIVNIQANYRFARQVCIRILLEEGVIPVAPYLIGFYTDKNGMVRENKRVTQLLNKEEMLHGGVDELRLYGGPKGTGISSGMWSLIKMAHMLDIPVVPMTPHTKSDYKDFLVRRENFPYQPGADHSDRGIPNQHGTVAGDVTKRAIKNMLKK